MTHSAPPSPDRVGYILDPRFLDHATPEGHPERPERLQSIVEMLRRLEGKDRWNRIRAKKADPSLLAQIHSEAMLKTLQESSRRPFTRFGTDTYGGVASRDVALLAAGSGVKLTGRVLDGSLDSGFALIRPPGHHAESNRIMGFCLLNNVALAAQAALQEIGIERVAIIDFDVHHGNGTQEIFYSRRDVFYLSTHQYPLYPGTGALQENGQGHGLGFTANFPLPAGLGDSTYTSLFSDLLFPLVEAFEPHLILVSAGYDAHRADPLATMDVSAEGFRQMTGQLNRLAAATCQGKIVYFLEGGYNLEALARSVEATIRETLSPGTDRFNRDRSDFYRSYREQAATRLRKWWPSL